eukprot:8317298-Karenia_brevis.AAC.1
MMLNVVECNPTKTRPCLKRQHQTFDLATVSPSCSVSETKSLQTARPRCDFTFGIQNPSV